MRRIVYSIDDVMRLAPEQFQGRVRRLDVERQRRQRDPARFAAKRAARHAAQLQRTPSWADHRAMAEVHAEAARRSVATGVPHHVDHDLPLRGRLVSGLHVAANLRVVPAVLNLRKGNRVC